MESSPLPARLVPPGQRLAAPRDITRIQAPHGGAAPCPTDPDIVGQGHQRRVPLRRQTGRQGFRREIPMQARHAIAFAADPTDAHAALRAQAGGLRDWLGKLAQLGAILACSGRNGFTSLVA